MSQEQPAEHPRFAHRLIVAAWVVVALAALPFAAKVNGALDPSARLQGSESARVEAALERQFKSPFAKIALLRIAAAPDPRTADGEALLKQVIGTIRGARGVQATISYLDREDSLFLGKDGSPIIIVGLSAPNGAEDALMFQLRETTNALRAQFAEKYPGLTFGWTGEAAVNADMRRVSADETRAAELRVLPLTLMLLIIAFRTLVSAILPIVCGALTIVVSLGAVAAVNSFWPVSIIVVSIISMVGLGLSIDYALLIVSRYRDGLDQGLSQGVALAQASKHGGRTVVLSGLTVAIGFTAMLLVRVSELRSIGIGGLLVTTTAVLVAVTLLPIVLAWLGPWINAAPLGLASQARYRTQLAALGELGYAPSAERTRGGGNPAVVSRRSRRESAHRFTARPLAARQRPIGTGSAPNRFRGARQFWSNHSGCAVFPAANYHSK